MPVTAKLSKLFYDRLGEEIAQELVDWFNSADYSGNWRQLNELTLARFDAKLELRMAHLDARIEQRFSALDAKVEQRIGILETNLRAAIARLEARIETRLR